MRMHCTVNIKQFVATINSKFVRRLMIMLRTNKAASHTNCEGSKLHKHNITCTNLIGGLLNQLFRIFPISDGSNRRKYTIHHLSVFDSSPFCSNGISSEQLTNITK